MIKDATFVSVWEYGFEIKSGCKVCTETNEVFDIEMVNADDCGLYFEILDREYIIIDGKEYDVTDITDLEPEYIFRSADCVADIIAGGGGYWYKF